MTKGGTVYLDHQATTPLDPRAFEAMLPYLRDRFGNPASPHAPGREARGAVEAARAEVARLIGAEPDEIVWTSGATESDNLAVLGVARASADRGRHVIVTPIEHKAVLDPARVLREEGFEVDFVAVDRYGRVEVDHLRELLRPDTVLVSTMAANNEIGTVAPLAEIAEVVVPSPAVWHIDAAQYAGKLPLNVESLGADLVSLSAHKVYGPKGVGALYVRSLPRPPLTPILFGGGHEGGLRSGTLNVPAIVGFGAAAEIARTEMATEAGRLRKLADRLLQALQAGLDGTVLHGHPDQRIPGSLCVGIPGVDGDDLVGALDDVAISSGSACTSGAPGPSYVLRAVGVDHALALCSVRVGVGRFTSEEEVDYAAARIVGTAKALRR